MNPRQKRFNEKHADDARAAVGAFAKSVGYSGTQPTGVEIDADLITALMHLHGPSTVRSAFERALTHYACDTAEPETTPRS